MTTERAANLIEVSEADDPRLADYHDIRDRDLRGPRGRPGLFITETPLPVLRMLSIPGLTKSVLISPHWIDRVGSAAPPEVPVYVAPESVVKSIAGFQVHRGVLAVGHRPADESRTLDAVLPRDGRPLTLLLCDQINGIDNIGLLFRNAAAFAVDAVVLSPRCHDPLYRKAIRVSIGHVLSVPWVRSTDWEGDLDRLKSTWRLTLVGAHTGDRSVALDDIPPPASVGVLVGQEYTGLSPASVSRCDHLARIPMAPGVDSLNASVAAAVCLHHLSRGVRV